MTKEQLNEYAVRISQSSKTELVVVSCEITVQYIKDAIAVLDTDKEKFSFYIKKAMDFVDDLSSSLDMKYEISGSLINLYMTVKKNLIHANAVYTKKGLDASIRIMERLGEAFLEVSKKEGNTGSVMETREQIVTGVTYGRNSRLNEYVVRK